MSASLPHNGCDTLMLGFDYELRRRGFAGNSCQIVLELSAAVDPVRLEKRLAALLNDLAAHKRMSLTSCLEETLLHTCDGVSPHTKSDLNYIQKLKTKHGIDYDSHASYRFVEE